MSYLVVRNTLGLRVSEIPDFTTEPQVEATPVFRDDNITVFSIPIVPTPHIGDRSSPELEALSNASVSENVLKRKRESSPESPSKRPSLDSTMPTTDGLSTSTTTPALLDRFLGDPKFDPATLEGNEADTWRRLIIDHMFTWVETPPKPRLLPKPTPKKGKRGQNASDRETPETQSSQVESSGPASLPHVPHWIEDAASSQGKSPGRSPKGVNPAATLKPLPTFTPPLRLGSTAYIVVGPQVRGKFDVKRAEELGLYGPLRGRVARGECVTFTVDDGAGGSVQRTVRPEDCIGEHETTKVSIPLRCCISCAKSMAQGRYYLGCTNT
jgi:ribonuclease Z